MRPAALVFTSFALTLLLVSGCRDTAKGTFGIDDAVMPSVASDSADISNEDATGWTCQLDARIRPFCRSVGFGPGHPYWQDYVQPLVGFSRKILPHEVLDWLSYEAGPGSICDEFWDEVPFDPKVEKLIMFRFLLEDHFGNCCERTTFIGGPGYSCTGPPSAKAPHGVYGSVGGTGYMCCGASQTIPPELCYSGPNTSYVHYYRIPRGLSSDLRPDGLREAVNAMAEALDLPPSYPSSPPPADDPICDHWGYGTDHRPIEIFE